MESLLKFLKRIHFFLIYLIFEVIAIVLAIGSDVRRNSVFSTSANYVAGNIYDFMWMYVGYFHLRYENENLTTEIATLKNRSSQSVVVDSASFHETVDTCKNGSVDVIRKYRFISAQVLNTSINHKNNFMTLNVGKKHGVKPDMGVISSTGVVGIVVAVSNNFSLAISILNSKVGISAKLKNNNFYGSLVWDGSDYRTCVLNEIPNHIDLNQGDTIVTSGFSAIFPPCIPVATIKSYEKNSDDNFYTIETTLTTDLKNIANVFVIENTMQNEQHQLEAESQKYVQ